MFKGCCIMRTDEAAWKVLATPTKPRTHTLCERMVPMTALYHDSLFLCSVCLQEKPRTECYCAPRSRFILCKTCALQGKHCSHCTVYKPFSEFPSSKNSHNRGGVYAYCKACANKRVKRRDNPVKRRAHKLIIRFNLSQEEYDAMFVAQGGVCAICKQPETRLDNTGKRIRALAVDHDHETGEVRGLLCGRCNYLLGYVRDDTELLQAAGEYLERYR
jgi:hypothetical protein